jgi:divalent metal cation (Fe/Co/Zn/Cd) transporter
MISTISFIDDIHSTPDGVRLAVQFIAMLLMFYGFVIGHEVVAFMLTFIFFYFAFLIFETRFFLLFEAKLKLRKKANDEKNTVHNHHAVTADGGSGCADEGTGR